MSLTIADYSARIRDSLVDAKDAVLRIPNLLSQLSLTTTQLCQVSVCVCVCRDQPNQPMPHTLRL